MAPDLVWKRLRKTPPESVVLDPMAGSGTTPAMAQRLGHCAIAFDSDPLAVKIARAWCSRTDELEFLEATCAVLDNAQRKFQELIFKTLMKKRRSSSNFGLIIPHDDN